MFTPMYLFIGDGILQCGEYYNNTSTPPALAKEIFGSFDTNGDCIMSADEVNALMTRMDHNGIAISYVLTFYDCNL